MPGFIADTPGVASRETHDEAEISRFELQPPKCGRIFKIFGQRSRTRSCNIDRPARVVFAEPRCRIDFENIVNQLPRSDLVANKGCLVVNAAKARNHKQNDIFARRRRDHGRPLTGSKGHQLLHAPDKIGSDLNQFLCLVEPRLAGRLGIVGPNAEFLVKFA